ncbi:SRPBCC domain-containing protein [Streptomyces sp. NPDC052225]|uniref:SRPBCC domain-containing protein n=1 Tax=Streptomyces sp. NPDC052225 TaxID=3154949 RepID=UPI003428B227
MTHTETHTQPAADTTAQAAPARRRRRPRLRAALAATALLLAGYTAWSNQHETRLTASVEIRATPDEVWRVLTDFAAYDEWNPFMTSARVTSSDGRLVEGARLHVVLHDDEGGSPFTPRVQEATPGKELRWLGKMGPGWIADGRHRFVVERVGPDRVRLTQSESFTGVAVPFAQGYLKSETLPQFRAMNKALAQRAESLGD